MENLLNEINDNLIEKWIYDKKDDERSEPMVLFSDVQSELNKHRIDNSFKNAAKPLMKWMAEKTHPHTTAIVCSNRAELLEGKESVVTDENIVD